MNLLHLLTIFAISDNFCMVENAAVSQDVMDIQSSILELQQEMEIFEESKRSFFDINADDKDGPDLKVPAKVRDYKPASSPTEIRAELADLIKETTQKPPAKKQIEQKNDSKVNKFFKNQVRKMEYLWGAIKTSIKAVFQRK